MLSQVSIKVVGGKMAARVNYRKLAFEKYAHICAYCGFGVEAVLEVAHIDGDRSNNELVNLVILCPNCHKMLDLDLIAERVVRTMRRRKKIADWSKRMKDAGKKAGLTRKKNLKKRQAELSVRARKAWETRKQNA